MTIFTLFITILQVLKRFVKYSWHSCYSKKVPKGAEFWFLSILLQYWLKFTDNKFYTFYDYSTSFKKIGQVFMAQVLFKKWYQPEFQFLSILLQYRLKYTDDNFYIFHYYSTSFKTICQVFVAQELFKKWYQMNWNSSFSQYHSNIA